MADQISARLHAWLYAGIALLLCGQATWFYLMGDYPRILLPAMLTPLMLVATMLRLSHPGSAKPSASLALICGYLMVAAELPNDSALTPFWLGLPPVMTLLLLPLGPAMLLNLTLAPLWLMLGESQLDLHLVLAYLLLVVAAGLASWEILHLRTLLKATDPIDDECSALACEPLHDRLHSECERAEFLGQRLAVLLIHLPQLEMAEEQFGSRARQALLEALCRTTEINSREHDLLGREGRADFWLILPDTTENGALLVKQRIEQSLHRIVLFDTGEIESRLGICHLRPAESPTRFCQRLQTFSQRLADT